MKHPIQRELLVESANVSTNALGDRVVTVKASQRGTFSALELTVTLSPEQAQLFPVGKAMVITLDDGIATSDDPDAGGQGKRKR